MSQYPIKLLKKKLGAVYPEDFKELIIVLQQLKNVDELLVKYEAENKAGLFSF